MNPPVVEGQVRGPGRPRDERADRAIVEATLEVLREVGPTGLSVEEVATRAGVGKATIYRRFPSKEDLVVEAIESLHDPLPAPNSDGGVRDALVEIVQGWWERHDVSDSGVLYSRVVAHAKTSPRMFECFFTRVIEPRRELIRSVVRRGIATGELRADTDVDLMTTMVSSSTIYHLQLKAGGRDAAPGATPADYVDAVLRGFAAHWPVSPSSPATGS